MPRHIKKGDTVIVIAGNDKGSTGEVLRLITKRDRVVVQGVNVRTKHLKPTATNPQGGIVHREMSIHMSNVCPVVDGKATRVRFPTKADGTKVRVAARNGKELHTLRGPRESAKKKGAARQGGKKTAAKAGK